jgi:hypothetical protein
MKKFLLFIAIVSGFFSSSDAQDVNKINLPAYKNRMTWYLYQHELKADYIKLGGILLSDKGVEYYKNRLLSKKDSAMMLLTKVNIADQLLKAGREEDAIEQILKILPETARFNTSYIFSGNLEMELKKLLALSYFKLGERLNCIINYASESCIIPLEGRGLYRIKDPSRKAIRLYLELLEKDSTDEESLWLMNIVYMSLGLYPDSIPSKYKINFDPYGKPFPDMKFKNIAPQLGLDDKGLSGSVIMDDFDNDNDLDIFCVHLGFNEQCRYFLNEGNGSFTDKTEAAGFLGEVSGRTCIQADYNNDGFLDIFIVRGAWERQENNFPPSSLMKNNGDGTFTDVTISSGLLGFNPSYNACWIDYNNDGWIDLFISNEGPDPQFPHTPQLFKNLGDGSFIDVAKESGLITTGWTKGVVSFDYNNDRWPDIYLCKGNGDNYLFKNGGKGSDGRFLFSDVAENVGVKGPQVSFYTLPIDYNNDGWMDLFVANSFFDFKATVIDYKTKSSPENLQPKFYENKNGRNKDGKFFEDVSADTKTGNLKHGHGVSFGDIDNDGDQDIYEVTGDGHSGDIDHSLLFMNPGNKNHWINIKLEGVASNRAAIGAKIRVNIQTTEGNRDIYTTVTSGGSFGASCLRREIGLADAKKINYIEVYWPSTDKKQVFKNVNPDAFYKIIEGKNKMILLNAKKMSFPAIESIDYRNHLHD